MEDRPRADRGIFCRPGRARHRTHRLRRRRPQAVDLLVPGRRHRGIRPLAPTCCASVSTPAGKPWEDAKLDVSFRSTRPVLELVDRGVRQSARRRRAWWMPAKRWPTTPTARTMPAQVELWPLTPLPDAAEPLPWTVPEQNHGLTSAPQQLAETLAHWIAREVERQRHAGEQGPAAAARRRMVLVRRRNDFGRALVRALKSRGVPVAGLDRLMLTEQPAVQDLMALADALLLPQDDLTFACVLTSPLGGLTDDSLMELAIGRPGHLWDALRARADERPDWHAAWTFFSRPAGPRRLRHAHTRCSPRRSGPLGGRARLLARLGPEAAEPVDELLNAALAYGRTAPAVAAGFPALAAPLRRGSEARGGRRRQPGARHDGARCQGIAGAAGDPARHHRRCRPRKARSSGRPTRPPAAACRSGRRDANCAAPPPSACAMRRRGDGSRSTTACSTSR